MLDKVDRQNQKFTKELCDETMVLLNMTKKSKMSKHLRRLLTELKGRKESHENQSRDLIFMSFSNGERTK